LLGCHRVNGSKPFVITKPLKAWSNHVPHWHGYPHHFLSCGAVAIVGGLLGSKLALKTKPKKLKTISGILTIMAAIIMMVNALAGK
jgi:hypothetical protein